MDSDRSKKHILFAEASDVVQEMTGMILEQFNCEVTPVASANAAFEELSSGRLRFDLVLVGDMSKPLAVNETVPELSVIRQARSLYPKVPILIFTSLDYRDRARESGATAYLPKPADRRALIAFIGPYLGFS